MNTPTNLKPFNLEEALAGKPVVTRDGRKVTEIYHFKTEGSSFPVCAIIGLSPNWFDLQGKNICSNPEFDLFMAPVTVTKWANIWKSGNGYYYLGGRLYDSKEEALMNRADDGANQHLCCPIQIEE